MEEMNSFYEGDYHEGLLVDGKTEAAFGAKYQRYADTLGRHLRSGRVVDVGCATGLLVRVLCDRGFDAEGIEPNPRTAVWGRTHYGVTIHNRSLELTAYQTESLHALLFTDVLEHTQHPRDFLRAARRVLVPGGIALVTFPDIRSLESRYYYALSKLLHRDWLWACCHVPMHTWEFTRTTAEACFASAGFEVLEFRRSQPREAPPTGSWIKILLRLPSRILQGSPFSGWLGTQMEFVIRRSGPATGPA
jgi:SAM-dependent methyltransferase